MVDNNIITVPDEFLTKTNHSYPPGNDMVFEEFFLQKFLESKPETNRIYLPIQWTCFYISRNYATTDMSDLQEFLNQLPRDKKYFTIVQWDDGIKNNLDGLDILKFASGGIGDYAIPLINKPHDKVERAKDIFASFIGVINGRHRVRESLSKTIAGLPGYYISERMGFEQFKEIMERSIFSLCPRGYGRTSFRINEALNLGSIPVYIYDDAWVPFSDKIDFSEYGVLVHESELHNLDDMLKSITDEQIDKLRENGKKVYEEYYSYEGCYNNIIKTLK